MHIHNWRLVSYHFDKFESVTSAYLTRGFIYVIASPRQCIDLYFDEKYAIEPSWECKFDHIEVRDGPFSFSPIIGRYCGQESPNFVRSSGRYLWIKFVADSELEANGFLARYNFTQGKSCVFVISICIFFVKYLSVYAKVYA